jgi:hypothetical protein
MKENKPVMELSLKILNSDTKKSWIYTELCIAHNKSSIIQKNSPDPFFRLTMQSVVYTIQCRYIGTGYV